jgi:hypothetical protein
VPGGPGSFFSFTLGENNAAGDVAFTGNLTASGKGVFRASAGGTKTTIALRGQAAPDGNGTYALILIFAPHIDASGQVLEIRVKQPNSGCPWVWGAFKMPGATLAELHSLWRERQCADEYIGTLVNAWLARGGRAVGVRAGTAYVDVGTLHGYREALRLLQFGEADMGLASGEQAQACPTNASGSAPQ